MSIKEFIDRLTDNGFTVEEATRTAAEYSEADILKYGLELLQDEIQTHYIINGIEEHFTDYRDGRLYDRLEELNQILPIIKNEEYRRAITHEIKAIKYIFDKYYI